VLAVSLLARHSESAETAPNASGSTLSGFAVGGSQCDPNDPDACALPIQRGVATPFSGQLLSPKLAISLGLKAQYCDARTALDVEHARALVQVDLDSERKLHALDLEAAKKAQELLEKRLAEANPWFERPAFVAVVTTVLVVSGYALAMKSVDWIKISR
jgi:hypothetical protein